MKIKFNTIIFLLSFFQTYSTAYSQNPSLEIKIDSIVFSLLSIKSTYQPEFNFIGHNSDENDKQLFNSHGYLIDQPPTEENYEKYIKLAYALWDLNKITDAEKMFLNIRNSKIESYTSTKYHSSGTTYGYGSFTSNYKHSACIYLAKINIEKRKFKVALLYLEEAVNKYEVYYTCGTGSRRQQSEYDFLYASCYQGLGQHKKVVDMLIPEFLDWSNPLLTKSLKVLYNDREIKKYLAIGQQSIKCEVDSFLSYSYRTSNPASEDEKVDTIKYNRGTGTIMLFGRKLDLPYANLENGEVLTRDYYVNLFRKSSFYKELSGKKDFYE